jgi:hypothetical protein
MAVSLNPRTASKKIDPRINQILMCVYYYHGMLMRLSTVSKNVTAKPVSGTHLAAKGGEGCAITIAEVRIDGFI